jgi:erythromycin esterase
VIDTTMHWINSNARPIDTTDDTPVDDLGPIAATLAGATVVALGASARVTHELSVVAARFVRVLVSEHGFRSIVLEGDEAASVELDGYLRTGAGDPAELFARARTFWRTEEMLGVVRWLRAWNEQHPDDPVRAVHPLGPVTPTTSLHDLAAVERALAETVLTWHEHTGHRIVYWGGLAHTTPREVDGHPSLGARLRQRFGDGFAHVALTLGTTADGTIPPPAPEHTEAVLDAAGLPAYVLDLRGEPPDGVRGWLDGPAVVRIVGPRYDPSVRLEGGSLRRWFDAVAHVRNTTPVHPLGSP